MKIQTFSICVGTKACNASCPFCVSKMTPEMGIQFKNTGFDRINQRNFHVACLYAKQSNVSTVLLTGKGEPTLYPNDINWYLNALRKYEFPFIELQTNGLEFGREEFLRPRPIGSYLGDWHRDGLTTIALSVAHYLDERNREIFTPHTKYIDLVEVIKMLHDLGFSIRLSCILMKNYIDSIKEMVEMIDFCRSLKVEQLTFRRIGNPEKAPPGDIIEFVQEHKISDGRIEAITEYFNNHGTILMDLMHGARVYDYDGQNMCLTDCLTIDPTQEKLRQLIYFPDGHLRYDWQYEGAILL